MPVPKRKTSKARRNKRSATWGVIKLGAVVACQTCQAPLKPHQVCHACGYYKGIKILRTKADRMHKRGEERKGKQDKTQAAKGIEEPKA